MKRIYFDYAATTPVDAKVLRAMQPYFGVKFGNAGSLHLFGQEAITAVDGAREVIAQSIGANFREVIFTGSATEANNLALRGIVKKGGNPKVIISAIEHESVMETAKALEKDGVKVVVIPVNKQGVIDVRKFEKSLDEQTVLVSVMYANNEIGTVQPLAEVSKMLRNFRSEKNLSYPLLHTDAVQAFQFLDCNVDALGADLMTISAHKIYGPKGIGALYIRDKRPSFAEASAGRQATSDMSPTTSYLSPIVTGGGQEFGLRSGTENTPSIIGFAKAVELRGERGAKESERLEKLMQYYKERLKTIYPKLAVHGPEGTKHALRLPNILNVHIPGVRAEELLMKWDMAGLSASAGSACNARSYEPSKVLMALGYSKEHAKESVRFSLGVPTTKEEVDRALTIIERSKANM